MNMQVAWFLGVQLQVPGTQARTDLPYFLRKIFHSAIYSLQFDLDLLVFVKCTCGSRERRSKKRKHYECPY
jgi:hypothetical protein